MPRELPSQLFALAVGAAKTVRVTMRAPPAGGAAGWDVRFRFYDPDRVLLFTLTSASAAEVELADPVAGVWDIHITTNHSSDLAVGLHGWDFWRTDAGVDRPIAVGTADVYLGLSPG